MKVSFLLLAVIAGSMVGQETAPTSRPVRLPQTNHGAPFADKDAIVVSVVWAAESETRPAARLEESRIVVGKGVFPIDQADRIAKVLREEAGESAERALLIKADGEVPYGAVRAVFEAARGTKIGKAWVAVEPVGGGDLRAIATPWPAQGDDDWVASRPGDPNATPPRAEIRVLLSWSRFDRKTIRLVYPNLGAPLTPAGDLELVRLIETARTKHEKAGVEDVPLVIDTGPGVPWQEVVNVLATAGRMAVKRVEIGTPLPPRERWKPELR